MDLPYEVSIQLRVLDEDVQYSHGYSTDFGSKRWSACSIADGSVDWDAEGPDPLTAITRLAKVLATAMEVQEIENRTHLQQLLQYDDCGCTTTENEIGTLLYLQINSEDCPVTAHDNDLVFIGKAPE